MSPPLIASVVDWAATLAWCGVFAGVVLLVAWMLAQDR